MQSDTIIGIVGAVVLVAVMVGVFAYEYNNAADDGDGGLEPGTDAAKMAAFNATYPGLDPMGDLDGDGVANYDDDNIDGDEQNNTADDDVSIHGTFSGSVGQRLPNSDPANTANTFAIEAGHKGGTVTVTWAPGTQNVAELTVTVTGPGDVACDNSANGQATCDLAAATAGEYTVVVKHSNLVAQANSFEGNYHVQY